MVISEKQHNILNYSVNEDYVKMPHKRTGTSISLATHFNNLDGKNGECFTKYRVKLRDLQTDEVFVEYISLSTMQFMTENEQNDYSELLSYLDEAYNLACAFIKANCLNYQNQLSFSKFHQGLPEDHLGNLGFYGKEKPAYAKYDENPPLKFFDIPELNIVTKITTIGIKKSPPDTGQ